MLGGITKLYLVSVPSHGTRGSRPMLALLVGSGSREWIEPLYITPDLAPLARLWAVVSRRGGDPLAVLDSCLAFFPEWFRDCAALEAAREALGEADVLDLDAVHAPLTASWSALRHQARERFRELVIAEASLMKWEVDPYAVLDGSGGTERS